jgi:hypothetical protein
VPQQLGVAFVRAEAMAAIARPIIAKVPAKLAQAYRVVPFGLEGREILVAVADPQNLERMDELGFALNLRVRPHLVTEVTLNYALERYYNVRREARFVRMGDVEAVGTLPLAADPDPSVRLVPGAPVAAAPGAASATARFLERLADVRTRLEVYPLAVQGLCTMFPVVVLMQFEGAFARGISAARQGAPAEDASRMLLTLRAGGAAMDVIQQAQILHLPHVDDPDLLACCSGGGLAPHDITIFPIFEGPTPALFVIGQGCPEAQYARALPTLQTLIGKLGCALQITTLRREINPAVETGQVAWRG